MVSLSYITLSQHLVRTARSVVQRHAASVSTSATRTHPEAAAATSAQPVTIPPPNLDGQPKLYAPKIAQLVDEIARLNLLEVSDLNELLRKRLNIKDVAVSYAMPAGGAATGAASSASATQEADAEEALPKAVKTSFKLKLVKYDESKKVALIKEIKALGDNMNLVQSKKFIESMPQVFKDNISKEEAEKLKAQLEKVGCTVEIE